MMLQKSLYLLIQLPINNDSSIVVLENFDDTRGVVCDERSVRNYFVRPSLLKMNTRCSFAFSDRLIEYLLGNVITNTDIISKNIEKTQVALSEYNFDYKVNFERGYKHKGIWDKDISNIIMNIVEDNLEPYDWYDQDGFINKDVEKVLQKRGISY